VAFQLWSGRAIGTRRATVGFALALACLAGAYGAFSGGSLRRAALGVLLGLAGAAALIWSAAMAHVGVVINPYGVRVHHALLPAPVVSVPMRAVRSITATDVGPTVWRRWGWTWVPGRSRSVIVRSGPALSIELNSGRRFVVSVDDPEHAVAIVNRVGIRAA
jgi:hypothetical protein